MLNYFMSLQASDKIQILAILSSTLISIVSIFIAIATLKQNSYFTREASRANIVFYIDKKRTESFFSLVIKNFGNSPGRLIKIDITPELSNENTRLSTGIKPLTSCTNIFLAPSQSVTSSFDFTNYKDKEFEVTITYETLGKTYSDTYSLDLNYRDTILTTNPCINNSTSALTYINESIREVSDRLL